MAEQNFKSGDRVVLTMDNLGALKTIGPGSTPDSFNAGTIGVIDHPLDDEDWYLIRIGEFNLGVSFVPAHISMFKKWEQSA